MVGSLLRCCPRWDAGVDSFADRRGLRLLRGVGVRWWCLTAALPFYITVLRSPCGAPEQPGKSEKWIKGSSTLNICEGTRSVLGVERLKEIGRGSVLGKRSSATESLSAKPWSLRSMHGPKAIVVDYRILVAAALLHTPLEAAAAYPELSCRYLSS